MCPSTPSTASNVCGALTVMYSASMRTTQSHLGSFTCMGAHIVLNGCSSIHPRPAYSIAEYSGQPALYVTLRPLPLSHQSLAGSHVLTSGPLNHSGRSRRPVIPAREKPGRQVLGWPASQRHGGDHMPGLAGGAAPSYPR